MSATLVSNAGRSVLSALAAVIIAKSLGAGGYGNLTFLLGSFVAIGQLTDMGSSAAFYTFLCRRRQSRSFVRLYYLWLAVQFTLVAAAILMLPRSTIGTLFVGHERWLVMLAFVANFCLTQLWNTVSQLGEAVKQTVLVQAVGILPAAVHLAAVLVLSHAGALTVPAVLALLTFEYLAVSVLLAPRLGRANIATSDETPAVRTTVHEYMAYCRPLVLYTWAGFLYAFADRWLLQSFGGSVQQGYFGVGQQAAALSLLATTAVLRVFWQEATEARERSDHARSQRLFRAATRGLFFISTWLCCLVIPFSRELLIWTVGSTYEFAALPVALLMAFPAYQTVGQIQGVFMYASGETRAYAAMGIVIVLLSLPVAYLVLAPTTAVVPGFGLGAGGVALKMLGVQVLTVSVQAWIIARRNRWKPQIHYLLLLPVGLLAVAFLCRFLAATVIGNAEPVFSVGTIVLTSVLFTGCSSALVWCWPDVVGLTRERIEQALAGIRPGRV